MSLEKTIIIRTQKTVKYGLRLQRLKAEKMWCTFLYSYCEYYSKLYVLKK